MLSKKILLNFGFDYFSKGRTGVGAYQANIIWGLNCEYDIVVPPSYKAELPKNAHAIVLSRKKRNFIRCFKKILPIDFFFPGYDIAIIGGFCYRHSKKTKQYSIIHDLMPFTEPENYTFGQLFYNKIAGSSCREADKIIAVSQSTKQAIHDVLKIGYNKISVVPNITDFYVENTPNDYFLFIGDMRKTKNLEYLIYGFAEYKRCFNGKEKLIIAGSKKYEYESLVNIVERDNLDKEIEFPGYVSDEVKKKLYSGTKGFVFLSDNEGFGIPLLEAAVNKIPVLCSDIPIFHEVLNESFAVYTNNKNVNHIAEGFVKLSEKKINNLDACLLKNKYSKKVFDKLINSLISE